MEFSKLPATWKRTFGFHSLLVFLDRDEIAGGEAWPGYCGREMPGAILPLIISVFDQAIEALPARVDDIRGGGVVS